MLGVCDRRFEQLLPITGNVAWRVGENHPRFGDRMAANVIANEASLARRGAHVTGVGLDYRGVLRVISGDYALRLLFDLVLSLGLGLLLSLRLLFSLGLRLLRDLDVGLYLSVIGGLFGAGLSLRSIVLGLRAAQAALRLLFHLCLVLLRIVSHN